MIFNLEQQASHCCEQHGVNCNQGRDCPEAAASATEVGAEGEWLSTREAWGLIAWVTLPWAAIIGGLALWHYL